MALKFLDPERQDDFELCLKAVQQDGFALQCHARNSFHKSMRSVKREVKRRDDPKFATYKIYLR